MAASHHRGVTDRPPPETVHVPDGPIEAKPSTADGAAPAGCAAAGSVAAGLPTFGRFQALAQLGSGAMGTVYRAHDDVLGRDVAIKTLTADGQLGIRERFLREARAIGAVQHPNILAIHDAGTEGETPYLVMELATDGTLRDRMQRGPIAVETAREVGIQIARALAAAHAAGIIHRDVKPANILATKERGSPGVVVWKLADFGIAHMPDSTLTMTGQFIGSPSYAAPESLRSGQFSAASDVYGLAATLYEALSGAPPHGDHDMRSVIRKLDHEAPALHEKRSDVPGSVGAAIMAGIARDPAQRPSAEDFARMLATTDDRVPVAPRAPRPPMSPRTKLIAGALATIAVAILAVALSRRSHEAAGMPTGLRPNEAATTPGNPNDDTQPVDDETAKQLLDQMQRDAEEQMKHPGKGWKKHRH